MAGQYTPPGQQDRTLQLVESSIQRLSSTIQRLPLVNGSLIERILLSPGYNYVQHKLDRPIRGWLFSRVYGLSISDGGSSGVSLLNSWANIGGTDEVASNEIDTNTYKTVLLRGTISGGTAAAGTVLFVLTDAAMYPLTNANRCFPVISNAAMGNVDVQSNGDVVIQAGSNVYLSLDSITYPDPAGTYTTPTFANSWVNYGNPYATAQYIKDTVNAIVEWKGVIKSGTAGGLFSTLAAADRPVCLGGGSNNAFPAWNNGTVCRVDCTTAGNMSRFNGSNVKLSLDGIWWPTSTTGWQDVSASPGYVNGFTNDNATWPRVGYYKDSYGTVYIHGNVSPPASPAGLTMFTLPTGYRPVKDRRFFGIDDFGGTPVALRWDVNSDGTVVWVSGGSTGTSVLHGKFSTAESAGSPPIVVQTVPGSVWDDQANNPNNRSTLKLFATDYTYCDLWVF